jgi:phage terminase large subunit GpA-like protein
MRFGNGCSLKWMSGSGGDEKRSSYTARVVVATEVDKMDTAGEVSREADPITQAEGRLKSYLPEERIIYLECTVSIEEGAIWQNYQQGSAGKIVKRCPRCREWVTPEREHLRGFETATNEFEAETGGYIVCPACETPITEAQRREMNRGAKLLHRGQEIDAEGNITGELPATWTLGFRWNAFDNHAQLTIGGLALEEYHITEAEDEQAKTKAVNQYTWTTPYKPPTLDLKPLVMAEVRERFDDMCTRDTVPADAEVFVGAIDCGKRFLHWGACAFRPEARGLLLAYGRWENPPVEGDEAVHVERAILSGLESLRDEVFLAGFRSPDGRQWMPQQVLVDAGYMPEAVYAFAAEEASQERFRPTIGRGSTQVDKRYRSYRAPKKTSAEIVAIGEEYHIVWDQKRGAFRLEANADAWKVRLFRALQAPVGGPGSIGFFESTNRKEHNTLAKHLTAEKPYETFEPGRGRVTQWMVVSSANHYLDVCYMLQVAGHLCGVRLIDHEGQPAGETEVVGSVLTSADGRPYLASER